MEGGLSFLVPDADYPTDGIGLAIVSVGRRSSGIRNTVSSMDMLTGEQIAKTNLTDWRKLGQGLHARYVVGDFGAGVRFVAAVGEAGDALGHHPRVTMGDGYVDFKLISDDAVYRGNEGTEHVVEWVTQKDVDLARRITEIADQDGNKGIVCVDASAARKD